MLDAREYSFHYAPDIQHLVTLLPGGCQCLLSLLGLLRLMSLVHCLLGLLGLLCLVQCLLSLVQLPLCRPH